MNTLSKLFALSAVAALFFSSCGNKTAGQQSSVDSGSVAAAAADTIAAQAINKKKVILFIGDMMDKKINKEYIICLLIPIVVGLVSGLLSIGG